MTLRWESSSKRHGTSEMDITFSVGEGTTDTCLFNLPNPLGVIICEDLVSNPPSLLKTTVTECSSMRFCCAGVNSLFIIHSGCNYIL